MDSEHESETVQIKICERKRTWNSSSSTSEGLPQQTSRKSKIISDIDGKCQYNRLDIRTNLTEPCSFGN